MKFKKQVGACGAGAEEEEVRDDKGLWRLQARAKRWPAVLVTEEQAKK